MFMRRVGVVLTVILVALTGCGSPSFKGDVLVFVAAPLSGFQANGGQTVLGGVNLKADELNKAGGLLGYRVSVVPLDDEADSDVAVEVAQQVAQAVQDGKKVLGVLGHYNSGQTLAAMDTYNALPIVVITHLSSEVSLTQKGYTRFFRAIATDKAQGEGDARFLVQTLKAQRIALVHADNPYGRGLRDQLVTALNALGQKPAVVIEIKEGAATQAPAVAAIRQAQADAVFMAGYETEGYVLLPELREAGLTMPFLASDGCFLSAFVDGAGKAAEGAYVSAFTPGPHTVADAKWWKAYQDVEHRNPDTYSVIGYSAMDILAQGVKKSATFNADKVAAGIRGLDITTLVGKVRYNSTGDLQDQRTYVFQVKNGDWVQVDPAP
jgi:branched-chain amino acid transport system substrate-binding protein